MLQKRYQDQYDYVLDCIYTEDEKLETPGEKLQYLVKCFHREYDSEGERHCHPNRQERIEAWLRGLPSCFGIAFGNWHIGNIGEEWGIVNTERQRTRFVENWWKMIAFRIIQLCDHYGVEFPSSPYKYKP